MKVIKITRAGYIYIFLTICLGFAAINTGNNLVYLITSALLGFMGISGFFGRKNIYNLKVTIEFPDEVFANNEFPLKVTLENKRNFFPAFLIKVSFDNKEVLFPFVEEKNFSEKYVTFKFKERGLNKIENSVISSPFPFNFFVRFNNLKSNFQKTVFPEPVKYPENIFIDTESNLTGAKQTDKKGFSGDILFIREYEQSDPIKLIHWKSSAKTDKLMVKELTDDTDSSLIIDFENFRYPYFEKKLSFIAYLVIIGFEKGKNVILKTEEKTITNRKEMLEYLALVSKTYKK